MKKIVILIKVRTRYINGSRTAIPTLFPGGKKLNTPRLSMSSIVDFDVRNIWILLTTTKYPENNLSTRSEAIFIR